MRKFTIYMLLAASAVPAMAAAQDQGERHGRQQSSEQSDNNNQRPVREARAERAQQNEQRQQMQVQRQAQAQQMQAARQAQAQQMQQAQQQRLQQQAVQVQAERQDGERGRMSGGRGRRGEQDGQARDEQMQQYRQQMEQRQAEGQQQGGLVERQGRYRPVPNINPNVVGRPTPENRDARYASRDHRRDGSSRWTNNWRSDNRYDWRRYRDQHRSTFRIGIYYDPFGYSYNRFGIGSYLYPEYYQANYWINDPWQYRLPPAYGSYRWIRYHDDALMIDTWTGEVVDVIYGFFW